MKFGLSLSKKIIILLIVLNIATIIVISSFSVSAMEKMNTNREIENLKNLTTATYNQLDSAVNTSIKNYLRAIAEKNLDIVNLAYGKYKSGEMTEVEAKLLVEELLLSQTIGETGYAYVVDSNGILQVHPFMAGENIKEYEFVKSQITQRHGYLSYMWQNPTDLKEKEKVLYMTYFEPWDYIISISSYKSEFHYLVKINDFKENILSILLGETGYIYILDSSGKLIVHPRQEGVNILDSVDSKGNFFIKEIIENKKGVIIYPWINPDESEKRDKIVVYDYYEPMDWYISSGVYIDELTEPFSVLKSKLVFIALSIICITIIVSVIYGKIIIYPIRRLIEAMIYTKNGNFDHHIESRSNDEIGDLTNIYNEMILTIKEHTEELETSNNTLETKVRERTEALELLSNSDGLTGIPNRRKLDNFLELQLNQSNRTHEPLSIIMIDIDNFKNYNDSYGHTQGDDCLIEVANSIQSTLERSTDLVGRYGGEEFVVVLRNTDNEGAIKVCEHIQKNLKQLNIVHESSEVAPLLTVSMGVVTKVKFNNDQIQPFYSQADEALYIAKGKGKNQYYCLF